MTSATPRGKGEGVGVLSTTDGQARPYHPSPEPSTRECPNDPPCPCDGSCGRVPIVVRLSDVLNALGHFSEDARRFIEPEFGEQNDDGPPKRAA